MFASKSVKKVRKFISKFFSEVSTGVRDGDDGGENVRVLFRSSINDGEDVDVDDDHGGNKSDGSSDGDDQQQ